MGLENDVVELARRVRELEARLARVERGAGAGAAARAASQGTLQAPLQGSLQAPGPQPHGVGGPPPPNPSTMPPPAWAPPPGSGQPLSPPPSPQTVPRTGINTGVDSETLLKWAGLTLVVLAALFLVGTAINRGWIGPELQLLGAAMAGFGLLAGAFKLAPTNRPWAVTLAVGGAIVLPVCAAAANAALDLWPDAPALAMLAVTTVGLAWVARRLQIEAVVVIAAVGALTLWAWITDSPESSVAVNLGWVGVVTISLIALSLVERWTITRLFTVGTATIVIWALAVAEGGRQLSQSQQAMGIGLVAVVAVAIWLAPVIAARLSRSGRSGVLQGPSTPSWLSALESRSLLLLPLWAWGCIVAVLGTDQEQPLALLGFAVIALFALALAAAFTVRDLVGERLLLTHVLGIGILLSVSLALLITDAPILLIVLSAQAAATAVLAWRFNDGFLGAQAGLLGLISATWAAGSMLVGLVDELSFGQHLANAIVIVLLAASAFAAHQLAGESINARLIGRVATVGAWVAGLTWIASVFIHGPQGQVVISGLWAIAGAIAIVVGVRTGDRLAGPLGMTTLAVVVIKMLTIDLAAVDTLWRVGLFFVIGAGLLRLGYLLPRLSGRPSQPDAPAASDGHEATPLA